MKIYQYICIGLSALFVSVQVADAQIGINTDYPVTFFHVDSKSDNGNTLSPTLTGDDVVIDAAGNLGIGTTAPTRKADINGNIRITDGTQKKNYALTSDADGLASWKAVITEIRPDMQNLGTGVSITLNSTTNSVWYPTGGSISLEPGKSIIRASFYTSFTPVPPNEFLQFRYTLSTNPSTLSYPIFLNPSAVGYVTATGIYPNYSASCSGFWLVENPTSTNQTLYLFFHVMGSANLISAGTYQIAQAGASGWWENIIAINKISG